MSKSRAQEKSSTKKKTAPKKVELAPEFANLGELLEASNGHPKGLSNQVSLEVAHRKGVYPYREKMATAEYEQEKLKLQAELLKVQQWVKSTGQRILILFEGRDAAGKGGTIKRFMEHLNPRAAHIIALEKPTEREMGQWYFQRYIKHLPTKGEMVFFDRSWYNRTGVERVMEFCTPSDYLEFLRQCPSLERMIANSGIKLVNY